jgi:hypothetical protein
MAKKRKKKKARKASARNKPDYQVFVSHATGDKWIAKVICEKVEGTGASTFRDDRDISGGDDIPEKLRQQIRRSQEMIVLLTPESVGSQWVVLEVGVAWGIRKNFRIAAVLVHVGTEPIPKIIKSKKAVNINDFDNYLSEVRKRVKKAKDAKN